MFLKREEGYRRIKHQRIKEVWRVLEDKDGNQGGASKAGAVPEGGERYEPIVVSKKVKYSKVVVK
jgi:hypothetical protein